LQHSETRSPVDSMQLAGAAWSWVGATLAESVAIYRALGVHAIDLIAVPGSRLDTYQIAADPKGQAERFCDLGVALSNLLVFFGTDFRDRAINSPDPAVRANNLVTFGRLLEFCTSAGMYSMTVLPGVEQQPHSRGQALAWAASVLNDMNRMARDAGVLLVYEPHVDSILQNPQDVQDFMDLSGEVKLVIDYSHGVSLGYTQSDLDVLIPYAGHVHLRQAAPHKLQTRWDEGVIDFPALIGRLKQTGYRGFLTLEYEHDKFWNMDQCDVLTETIKMRNAVLPSLM
jgi:sugar phosphate isomerase/epimerase